MIGIILLNGQPPKNIFLPDDAYVVCCDGAYNWVKKLNIKPNIIVGDFDSLGYIPDDCQIMVFPSEKNETDGEIALDLLAEKGCKEVFVFGAFGKRTDHFLGNLALLGLGIEKGIKVKLFGDFEIISLEEGLVKYKPKPKSIISLVPYGDAVHIINSKGLKYPLDDLILTKNDTRGISNIAFDDEIEFCVKSGRVLILETWREE